MPISFNPRQKQVQVPIGMQRSFWAPFASEPAAAMPTYGDVEGLGAARTGTLTVQVVTSDIEGDDQVLIHFAKFQSGQLVAETTFGSVDTHAAMFGHTVTDGVEHAADSDEPPFGAYAFTEPIVKTDKSLIYRASFFPKVSADPASEAQNAATRQGGQISPAYPSVTFTVYACNTGDWRLQKEFSGATAEADALAWIKTQFGVAS